MKKMLSMLLAVCLLAVLLPTAVIASEGEYYGKTVIIVTGDIRGDIDILPLVASARAHFEAQGADVIVADTGNFLQGTRYSAFNSGSTMITLMIAAGYDVVALGTYDFAFGTGTLGTAFHGDAVEFGPLGELLEMNPTIRAVAANISGQNEYFHSFTPNTIITTPNNVQVGFLGLTYEGTANYILESSLTGIVFTDPVAAEAAQNAALTDTDILIALSNTGGLMGDVGINGILGVNPPSGTNALALVFDNETGTLDTQRDPFINLTDFTPDPTVEAAVNEFRTVVHAELPIIGFSAVTLDGSATANRSGETNLGNFWADALRWFAVSGEINAYFGEDDVDAGNDRIHVPDEYVVAIWNAGNLRDFIYPGDITIQDLRRVLPFPNTVAVVYLTGAELLEQLEASAQGLPFTTDTFPLTASFMHVSGIEYTINTSLAFNPGESYRERIWYTAASVERVTITSINGRPFNENALYAVITSNANFNGMDISYVLAARENDTENWSTITTARVVDHAVASYIASLPNATIGAGKTALQGRILLTEAEFPAVTMPIIPPANLTRGMFVNLLYTSVGSPEVAIADMFTDVPEGHPYAVAIAWAAINGIAMGIGDALFAPDRYVTPEEMAIFTDRFESIFGGSFEQ